VVKPSGLIAVIAVIAVTAVACAGTGGGGAEVDVRSTGDRGPSALVDPNAPGLPEPLVDTSRIISGGPPPDGIPPIDDPTFENPASVDWLNDREPVLAISVDGDSRAYPVQIMTWHEIANDVIGDVPVTVSYCPLCNSAIAYDRRIDGGEVLDFGTSGQLYLSALVMYDRQTQSLWSHFTAQAIAGVLTGTTLETVPITTVAWAEWRDANPKGRVLSRDTGFSRDYGRNPYPGYDDVSTNPFLFDGEHDGRLAAKEHVIGVRDDANAVAISNSAALDRGVIEISLGDRPLVVFKIAGTASALDSGSVADGFDVGATGVFSPVVDGRSLQFTRAGGAFVDTETGSSWSIFGEATDGPLAGTQLETYPHVDTFWFAWGAFEVNTTIVT
jgi:hypothetical protein